MNLKPGQRLAYTVTREQYYSAIVEDEDSIYVGSTVDYGNGVETDWEFKVSADLDEVNGLKVELFDDAFRAFAEAPEVFTALAEMVGNAPMTLPNFRDQLDRLGAVDATTRVNPLRTVRR